VGFSGDGQTDLLKLRFHVQRNAPHPKDTSMVFWSGGMNFEDNKAIASLLLHLLLLGLKSTSKS